MTAWTVRMAARVCLWTYDQLWTCRGLMVATHVC